MGTNYHVQRWVLKVEERHRLRLTPEIVARIPWLAKADGPVTVSAVVDEHGGIRILAPKSGQHRRHEEIAKRVSAVASEAGETSNAILSLARRTANTVSLTFSKDRSRISIVLPKELRAQGAPSKGDAAVIFVYGNRVEIWHAKTWAEHMRMIDGKHEDLVEECADDLGVGEADL